jgi:hypothetical protein
MLVSMDIIIPTVSDLLMTVGASERLNSGDRARQAIDGRTAARG